MGLKVALSSHGRAGHPSEGGSGALIPEFLRSACDPRSTVKPRGGPRVASLPGAQQRQVNAADGTRGLRTHLQGQRQRPRQAHSHASHTFGRMRTCALHSPWGPNVSLLLPSGQHARAARGAGRLAGPTCSSRGSGPPPIPCDVRGPGCPGRDCVLPGGRPQGLPQSPDAVADLPGRGRAWGKNLVTGVLPSPLGLPVRQGPQAPGPWRSLAAARYLGHRAQGLLQEGPATVQGGSDVPRSLCHRAGRRPP